jgi:hypothetical protein
MSTHLVVCTCLDTTYSHRERYNLLIEKTNLSFPDGKVRARGMRLIRNFGLSTNPLSHRRNLCIPADEIDAIYHTGSAQRSVRVRNVSPTGLYLLTPDRWATGAYVPLTLRKWTLEEKAPQPSLQFRTRAVRQLRDGMELAFLYEYIDTTAWLSLVDEATPRMPEGGAMRMLRFTRAIAFLCRICPSREAECLNLILGEMAFESGEKSLDILIRAEQLLSRCDLFIRADVSPALICQILFEGSKAETGWVWQYWAGLLAAASLQGGNDEKNMEFADLLSMLDPVQLRILAASCTRPSPAPPGSGEFRPQSSFCTAETMRRITHVRDLAQIECALDHLYELGLLGRTVKRDPFAPIERANLTPTRAGLALYAKCMGHLRPAGTIESTSQMSLFAGQSR